MAEVEEPTGRTNPSLAPAAPSQNLGATLLRVAWLAILLGFAMEGLLLLIGAGFGKSLGLGVLAADLLRNVSWSVFVCVGLAVGTTVAKARLPVAGLAGFLAAPAAFEISRVVHKGVAEALAITGEAAAGAPFAVAVVKGLEYGCLGMAVAWIGRRPWGGAAAHAATGFLIGLVFGGVILGITLVAVPDSSTVALISQGVNEILFPVGCALVLFSAAALGKRLARRR